MTDQLIKCSTIFNSEIRRNYSSINLGDSDSGITSSKNGSKKDAQFLAKSAANYFVNSMINNLNKKFTTSEGSGIILTNNGIKDIKLVQSLENRGILSTETTEKVMKQKVVFLGSLMRLGLPLMKNVLTPLAAKCYLDSSSVSNRCSYSKENLWTEHADNPKQKFKDILTIVKHLEESCLLVKQSN